jgi:hypothetical protein
MTEEEIRGNLLLPFLKDLGFDASEISLENAFTIRLGKSQHIIKGRSDILCKRNGKNLFIVELKNDSLTITQKDIDQGISYARLLDNIAPFTIITNGKATRVFDSVSREELTGKKISKKSSYWQNGCSLSTDIDLRIRYEALKNFVSFSEENLKQFCETQVRDRMGSIIGDISSPYSKFIKELYVQRQGLQNAFDDFINSKASLFGIVGPAGVGKTTAMCSLALQKLEDRFVFFYNAAIINKSPLEHISQDLNGVFSSKSDSEIILRRLDELGQFLNRSVVIFIDAIDESTDQTLSLELSEIALAIRNLVNVKVCISCKSNIWKSIVTINGSRTHLYEELAKSHNQIPSLDNCPGFLLEDFSNEELKSIIPLYKKIFGFKGQISEDLLNELRNGFYLRIFSEVYNQKEIPVKIDDQELIKRYIKQSLEKTNIGLQSGLRILSKIGEIVMSYKYSFWDAYKNEGLEVVSLLERLNFSLDETIPEDLFGRNLLIRSNKEDSYNVTFYYSKIRDYIICFHSYKLDKLSDNEFYSVLINFHENHIGQSAISFYIQNASTNHKSELIKFKKNKALEYVNTYDNYLNENFKNFKEKFNPGTKGEIGIYLPNDILEQDGYALFHLAPNSSIKVQQESFGSPFSKTFGDSLFGKKGVQMISYSNISIMVLDQEKVVRENIFKQLKEIINKGSFTAYNSDILLLEIASSILYYYYDKLGYEFNLKDYYLPRYALIYPLNLANLRDRIYEFRANHYFRKRGFAYNQIPERVHQALAQNSEIPKMNIIGDFPPFEELFQIVEILISRGYDKIENHHLPYPDKSVVEIKTYYDQNRNAGLRQIRSTQFSAERAKVYIESFFGHLESCYKEFVEDCFPTFKENLPFYKSLPHEYFFYLEGSDVQKWGSFGYHHSDSNKVIVNFRNYRWTSKSFEDDRIKIMRGFSLDSILHSHYNNQIPTIDRFRTPKVDDSCVIRNWVYKLLKEDMEGLYKENDGFYKS